MIDLTGKNVVVIGLGESGVAAAELALRLGARVLGADAASEAELSPRARELASKGVRFALGRHDVVAWKKADLAVVSPGVPALPALDELRAAGVEIIGELELAARCIEAPVVAIGGTNGKSTTTALVHAMLEQESKRAFIGGNFGTPLSFAVGQAYDVLVLEVSSFQMERAPTFHPNVAALLNVSDDHLDRYASFLAYVAAKGNMFVNQTPDDVAVIPKGDAVIAREAHRGEGRIVTFGTGGDVSVVGDAIVDRLRGHSYPLAEVKLHGAHNWANACAAIACASEAGAGPSAIAKVLSTFAGLPHRTAFVSEVAGVKYYDDSKGTNVGAAVSALRGLAEERVVLIAGGRDKLGSYAPLADELQRRGRGVVLIGEAAERIAAELGDSVPARRAASMDEAVVAAAGLAEPGDAVLLSPACSSYDMFRDYKERGDSFVRAVLALSSSSGRDAQSEGKAAPSS
jgi:UDP-N-acetylmuramoylalanine--D-glutamate ligase